MNKKVKVIIAGAVIAVVGVVVLLCALGMSGWNVDDVSDWQQDSFSADGAITKLQLKVNVGKVIIKKGDTEKVGITYEYNNRYQPKITESAGVLNVETGRTKWYEFNWFQLNLWVDSTPTMEVVVPQNSQPQIDLVLNAGTVELGDGNWGALIDVELNAGAMTVGNVVADQVKIDISAGAFSADKIESSKVTCNMSAGGFDVKEVVCNEFACDISAGGVNVKKLDSRAVKVDVSAGSANLGLAGTQSDYNVRVDKSAGSCNVSSQTNASATRTLFIDISAGSVTVTFGK